jgi:hypothetical protein
VRARPRLLVGFALAVLCALVLTGCIAESRLDEFQADGDALALEIIELVPEELEATLDGELDSHGVAPQNGVFPGKRANDSAYWSVRAYASLIARDGASAEAIVAVTEAMVADGWTACRVREVAQGLTVVDGFHRDGWYVEIAWVRSRPGHVERFDIWVVSPRTVRGDHDEISS